MKRIPLIISACCFVLAIIYAKQDRPQKIATLPTKIKEVDCVREFQAHIDSILRDYVCKLYDKGIYVDSDSE